MHRVFVWWKCVSGLSMAFALSGLAAAQQWPAKPVRWIVPNAPGSSPDIVARMVADRLSRELGQSFLVDLRAGGQGIPAAEAVARAAPDGYTLLQAGQNLLASNPYLMKSIPYDPARDFTPVAMLVESAPFVLAVNPNTGANTMPDLAALARKQPGKLSYAASASLGPILGQWLMKVANIDMVLVPYKETMASAQDTISNLTQMVIIAYPSIEPLVKAGKLRVIAVTSGRRFPGLESVPALAEHYPGFQLAGWFVVAGPAKMPAEISQRLNREVDAFLREPETQKRMTSFGFIASGALAPAAVDEFLRSEREKWKRIVQEVGLKPE
jgi:tripartite-type tricarboxylate transporter receptor subunit TctC